MQNQAQKQQLIVAIIMLLIGFLIGVLITAGWYQGNDTTPSDTATTTQDQQEEQDANGNETDDEDEQDNESDEQNGMPDRSNDNPTAEVGSDEVSVEADNQDAGDEVLVSEVAVPEVSWVAVREQAEDGMGNVLGAKRVEAGTHSDVTVRLLRGTEAGQTYYVTVYQDDGDLEFSHLSDMLYEVDGSTVFTRFNTTQ